MTVAASHSEGAAVPRVGTSDLGRIVGGHTGGRPGPLFLIVGAMHGNEPAGPRAAQRVLAALAGSGAAVRGHVLALIGNTAALAQGLRYVRRDLNRMWTEEEVRALHGRDPGLESHEELEQRRLLAVLEEAMAQRTGPVVLLDLHSSSAEGEPFLCMGDTLKNRRVAAMIPTPVILGLEENIDGALLEYFSNRGHIAIAIEGGQHDAPTTVDNHEAAIWLALVATGVLAPEDVPDLERHRGRLDAAREGLPRVMEIRHRHGTREGDGFHMEPGFRNFMPIRRGQLLARDGTGEIRARERGRIVLPRYQGQGNDGFFTVRRVRPFWLRLSAWLRRLGMEPLLTWLPGVARHPTLPETLRVNPRVARWLTTQVFHLFGYRRLRSDGGHLAFGRRREEPIE